MFADKVSRNTFDVAIRCRILHPWYVVSRTSPKSSKEVFVLACPDNLVCVTATAHPSPDGHTHNAK